MSKSAEDAMKLVTERDAVLRERAAFRAGVNYAVNKGVKTHENPHGPCFFCDREAARLYPLPCVTRPRVVKDSTEYGGEYEWRVVDGVIQHRANKGGCPWRSHTKSGDGGGMFMFPERIRLLADLLANPTETVEVDE